MHILAALLTLAAATASTTLDPDRLAGFKARNIGPAGMSGRVAAVAAVPSDPRVVYAGAATGGLWRSRNGGLTWEPVFDDQPVHAIGSIAIAPQNPDVVWVGTGEGNTRNSVSIGNGVYRSLDAGRTWAHLGLEKTERIHKIGLDPVSTSVAYVCATGPEWGETEERGVFKTEDGGRTWKKVLYVDTKTGCGDLAVDPRNPGKVYAAMWQFRRWPWFFSSGGPGSGLYVTHDGGASWRKLQEEDGLPKGELGRIGLAVAPSDPQVVYAIVEADKSAVVRSTDGGRTWKVRNDKPNVAPRPFYFNEIRVDPKDADRLYSLDYNIRVSEDGGKTFTVLPGATWAAIHGDHHDLWIDPADPTRMYDGNDGGVAVSHDRGRTFRFVENLPLAQYYHVAVDDARPFNVYGGLQDNGSWRGPSAVWQQGGIRNHHWLEVGGGDGFETVPRPGDPTQGYSLWQGGNLLRWDLKTGEEKMVKPAAPEGTRLRFNWNAGLATDPFDPAIVYLGSQFLHRSTDRGDTWQTISPDLTTNDPAKQKQDTSGGLTTDVTAAENHTTIIAIAPSPVEKGLLWVGTDDGRLHVSRDAGATWTSVEKALVGVPPNTWIPHVEPSRHAAGTAFVVLDNHRRADTRPYVFRTDDYGRTWRSLVTSDVRGYALSIRQDPVDPDLVFLGTEFALYFSKDGGRSWSHLKKTLPTASVHDLAIHPRDHDLVIGTHGRALWILDDVRPLRSLTAAALQAPLTLYPASPAVQHWVRPADGGFGFGAGEFQGENRPYGAILTYSLNFPDLPVQDEEKERARKEGARADERRKKEATETGPVSPPAPGAKPPAAEAAAPAKPEDAKKTEEKSGDKEPKVDVTVADASGKVVRRFKAPARLGVNRAAWDLRRDAFRALPKAEDAPAEDEEPGGPEVPPGTYTVTVSFRGQEGRQPIEVQPDPRSANRPADWTVRYDAIQRAGALHDAVADAIWRIRRTRDDVALVQERAKQAAEAAGEKDPEKRDALPLVKSGDKVIEALGALEKKLWQSPEATGILPDTDVVSRLFLATASLESSWDPPSPNQLEHLRQVDALLRRTLSEVNAAFDGPVAAFRKEAEAAGIALLASPPVALPPR